MVLGIESVLIFSEDATKLAKFYREKLGLNQTMEAEMGENGETNLFGFEFKNGPGLAIIDHSKVKGENKNPERMIFNLEVDDIEKEADRLKKEGVKQIQEIYHVENYGYVSTFEDLDGNYFQITKTKA